MDLLMAIALLCQTKGSMSGLKSTDAYQLQCQKEYLACYLGHESKDVVTVPALELQAAKEKKYLYQCVLERKTPKVVQPEQPNYGNQFYG